MRVEGHEREYTFMYLLELLSSYTKCHKLSILSLQDPLPLSANLMEPNMKMEWSRCADLPQGMSLGLAVVLDGKVYYGGGDISPDDTASTHIRVFDFTGSKKWSTLPTVPYGRFGLAVFRGQLVLVGGWDDAANAVTSQLLVWDAHSSTWIRSLPPMPTARNRPSALGYNKYLLVAGGWDGWKVVDIVEILNGDTREWFKASPLPVAGCNAKTAYHKGDWYLMGGDVYSIHSSVVHTSVHTLIDTAQGRQLPSASVWASLPDLPMESSPLAIWGGALLAMGGIVLEDVTSLDAIARRKRVSRSSNLRAYCPHTNSWYHIGEMPTQGCAHTAVSLPTGELLVMGGTTDSEDYVCKVFEARLVARDT